MSPTPMTEPVYVMDAYGVPIGVMQAAMPLGEGIARPAMVPPTAGRASSSAHEQALATLQWARFRTLRAKGESEGAVAAEATTTATVAALLHPNGTANVTAAAPVEAEPLNPLDAAVLEAEGELRGAHVAAALARRVAKREAEAESGTSAEMRRRLVALRDARRKVDGMVSGIAVALDLEETQAMDAKSAEESGEVDRVELTDPNEAATERDMPPAEIELRASQAKSLGTHLDDLAEAKRKVERELAVLAALERKRSAALDDLEKEVVLVNEALVKYGRARSAQLERDLVQAAATLKRAREVSDMVAADADQATTSRREAEKALRDADRALDSTRNSAAEMATAGQDSGEKLKEARKAVMEAEDALRHAAHMEDQMHLRGVHAQKAVVLSIDAERQMQTELAEIQNKVEFAERMLSGEPEPAPMEAASEAGAEGAASAVAAEAAATAAPAEHEGNVVTLEEVDDDLRLSDGAADKALEVLKRLERLAHAAQQKHAPPAAAAEGEHPHHEEGAAPAAAEGEHPHHEEGAAPAAAEGEHPHHEEESPKFREVTSTFHSLVPEAITPEQTQSDDGFNALMQRVLGHAAPKSDEELRASLGVPQDLELLQFHASAARRAALRVSHSLRRQDANVTAATSVVNESAPVTNASAPVTNASNELNEIEAQKAEAAKAKAEAELAKLRAEAEAAQAEASTAIHTANETKTEAEAAHAEIQEAKNETLAELVVDANATEHHHHEEEEEEEEAHHGPAFNATAVREEMMSIATKAAEKAAADAATSAAKKAAEEAAELAAEKAADKAAEKAASKAAEHAAKLAASEAADRAAEKASELAAKQAAKHASEMASESAKESHAEAANNAAQGVLDAVAQKLGRPMPRMGARKGSDPATLDNVAEALIASGTGPQPSVEEIRQALDALKDSDFHPTDGRTPPAVLDDALPAVMHAAVGAAATHKADEAAELAREAQSNEAAAAEIHEVDAERLGREEALAAAAGKRFVSPDARSEGGCRNKLAHAHSALGKSQHALSLAVLSESDAERQLVSATGAVFTPGHSSGAASPHATSDLGAVGATGPMTSQLLRSRRQTVARARSAVARARDVLERLRQDCPDLSRPGEADVMDAVDDSGMAVAGGDLVQRHVDLQGHQYFAMHVTPDLATKKQKEEAAQLASDIASAANQMHQAREALAAQQQALNAQLATQAAAAGAAGGDAAATAAAAAAGGAATCGAPPCAATQMAPHSVVPVRTATNATTSTEMHEDIAEDGSSTKTHTHHHHVSTEIILPMPAAPAAATAGQHSSSLSSLGGAGSAGAALEGEYTVPHIVSHASHNAGLPPLPAKPAEASLLQEGAARSMTVSKALSLLHTLNADARAKKIPMHGDARATGVVVKARETPAKHTAPTHVRMADHSLATAESISPEARQVQEDTQKVLAKAVAGATAASAAPANTVAQLQRELEEAHQERDAAIKAAAKAELSAQEAMSKNPAVQAKAASSPADQLRAARFALMKSRTQETFKALNAERAKLGLPMAQAADGGEVPADVAMSEAAGAPMPDLRASAEQIGDDSRLKEVSSANDDAARAKATLDAARAEASPDKNQAIEDVKALASAYSSPVLADLPRPSADGADSMDAYAEAQRYMQKMSPAEEESLRLGQDQLEDDAQLGDRLSTEAGSASGGGASSAINAMQATSMLAHSQALKALQEASDIQNRYASETYRFATSNSAQFYNPLVPVGGTSRAIEDANPPESGITMAGRVARESNPRLRGYVPLSQMGPTPAGAAYQEAAAYAGASDPEIIAAARSNP
jgi:trimeric autotransporter adhesin